MARVGLVSAWVMLFASCTYNPLALGPADLGTATLSLDSQRVTVGSPVVMTVHVTLSNLSPGSNIEVVPYLDGQVTTPQTTSQVTDVNGDWTGTLTGLKLGSHEVRARLNTPAGESPIDGIYTVEVVVAPPSTPATVSASAGAPATVGTALTDPNGNPLANQNVTFSCSGCSVTISPLTVVTDANGYAQTTITSTTAGTYPITITSTSGITQTVHVTFLPGPPSATNTSLTVAPDTAVADGTSAISFTMLVADAYGNAIPNQTVTFTSADSSTAVFTPPVGTTDATGHVTAALTATAAQIVTGSVQCGSIVLQSTVQFTQAVGAHVLSLKISPSAVTADGTSKVALTVTLLDAQGAAVPSHDVGLSATGSNNIFGATGGTTDTQGNFATTLASTTAEAKVVTATSESLSMSASVTFNAGSPNAIFISGGSTAVADNANAISITATVKDIYGNVVGGQTVTFTASGSRSTFSPAIVTSDNTSGNANTAMVSNKAESKTVTAKTGNVSATWPVTFVAGPVTSVIVAATPPSVPANGTSFVSLSAGLYDIFLNNVPGQAVTFSSSGTHNVFSPNTVGVTNASGVFNANMTSTTVETKTVSASANGVSGTVNVTFGNIPTISVSPTSGLFTTESGGTTQFTVSLTAAPTSAVVLPLNSNQPSVVSVSPSAMTFTPGNWTTAQLATLTGHDEGLISGSTQVTIFTGPATSLDNNYNGFDPCDVTVNNQHNAPAVLPLFSNASAWNTWVVNDANVFYQRAPSKPAPYLATGTPCVGNEQTEQAGNLGCIHGGETFYVNVTSVDSCANLTATDSLGAFNWTCDQAQGTVRFTSELNHTAGLASLIHFADYTWRNNSVTVQDGATPLFTTASSVWWSNPVIALNSNSPSTLTVSGAIYAVANNLNFGNASNDITLNANNISLVFASGTTLTGGNVGVYAQNQSFLWVEGGTFNGNNTANIGVWFNGSNNTVLRNSVFSGYTSGAYQSGVKYDGAVNHMARNLAFTHCGGILGDFGGGPLCGSPALFFNNVASSVVDTVQFTGSIGSDVGADHPAYLYVTNVVSNSAGGSSICGNSPYYSQYSNIQSASANRAVEFFQGGANFVSNVYAANSNDVGMLLDNQYYSAVDGFTSFNSRAGMSVLNSVDGSHISAHNVLIAQSDNSSYALLVSGTTDSVFANVTVTNVNGTGIEITQNSNSNVFMNVAVAGASAQGISIDSNVSGNDMINVAVADCTTGIALDSTLANHFQGGLLLGGNGSECFAQSTPGQGLTVSTALATAPGFGDCSTDAANSNITLQHGVDFATSYLGFANDPCNATQSGGVGTYNASSLDWFHFYYPNRGWGLSSANVITASGATRCNSGNPACRISDFNLLASDNLIRGVLPPSYTGNGNAVVRHVTSYGSTLAFLANAVELPNQPGSNNNFLCEKGELCVYTPNYGSYQGHGLYGYTGATGTADTIPNVTQYRYLNNGY